MTARHSSTDMLKKKRSRRMPALFTTTSMRPNASSAACTMRLAQAHSATLSELAIVAVAGEEAVRAVEACAARGVNVAVVMTSGFAETGTDGARAQARMASVAAAHGMRLIGPNCQGLANFATGMVA